MKLLTPLVITLLWALSASAITIDTVPVGNVGNAPDPEVMLDGTTGYGSVGYVYQIGKYEVTVGQYTGFLNAVAATDTYSLYNASMATNLNIAGIAQSGDDGSYTYSVIGSPNHPVAFVNWGDAARFANWLHNGQPSGAQNASTTEDGAYSLSGAITNAELNTVSRNAGAKWFIPSENEWYKAAYHQPAAQGGNSDNYWNYPMRTNSEPYSDQPPGATPDNTRVGNFRSDDDSVNGYNDGYAVTGSDSCDAQNCLTDVGAYTASPSFYGTFDQGGNVFEWNGALISGSYRGVRGGSWDKPEARLRASFRTIDDDFFFFRPTLENARLGFRMASISGVAGDYNDDGTVDAADYVLWRKGGPLANEVDTPGTVNAADYTAWRARFGNSGSGSGGCPCKYRRARADNCIAASHGSACDLFSPSRDRVINSSARDSGQQPSMPCKSAISSGCESHPANRSLGRKQPERRKEVTTCVEVLCVKVT